MVKILIDNGHGENTMGKQSPDGRLHEYAYAREIAKRVEKCLKCKGYDVERIVPEDFDISLSIRCKRVNDICRKVGSKGSQVQCRVPSADHNAARLFPSSGVLFKDPPNKKISGYTAAKENRNNMIKIKIRRIILPVFFMSNSPYEVSRSNNF